MDRELLLDMARHQAWADGLHFKAFDEHPALREDSEIVTRLNHMTSAMKMLTTLARGKAPDPAAMNATAGFDELRSGLPDAHAALAEAVVAIDLDRMIPLPRGPQGPFSTPAGTLLLQAITHSQHHRGQNASRMRQLGITPPMTDFVIWYAMGRP